MGGSGDFKSVLNSRYEAVVTPVQYQRELIVV